MKKIMLLSLSTFGMTNFANAAWVRYTPQTWTPGANGTSIVTCQNTPVQKCTQGSGDGPVKGEKVTIFYGGEYCYIGVIMNYTEGPPPPDVDPSINETTILEVYIDQE